jgi:hypothetical protein
MENMLMKLKGSALSSYITKVHRALKTRDMKSIKSFCIGMGRKRYIKRAKCRKFQAYCIGVPRTGTSSISGLFHDYYRSGHEVDSEDVLEYALDYREGKIGLKELERFVLERDERLYFEMDSSTHNYYLVPVLIRLFPDAKFLIPVRNIISWADSYLDYGINNRQGAGTNVISPQRTRMNKYRYADLYEKYSVWDKKLEEYAMPSMEAHLLFYKKHYEKLFELIPENRRILYETRKLDQNIPRICTFLGINPSTLNLTKNRLNTRRKRHHMFANVDALFLKEKVEQYCRFSKKRFYPGLCLNCIISEYCRWNSEE